MKRLLVQTPAMARKFLLGVVALAALAWPRGSSRSARRSQIIGCEVMLEVCR